MITKPSVNVLLVLAMLLHLAGCASQGASNELPSLETAGKLADDVGIMLVSTGRGRSGGLVQLPFVSYGVYREGVGSELERVSFLPAEAGFANRLGKGKYGFIHVRELPAGKYYLIGQKGRGNALDNPLGLLVLLPSGAIHYETGGDSVGISLSFEIAAGKVSYLGEILVTSRDLGIDTIALSDQSARDYPAIRKEHPALQGLEFIVQTPRKLPPETDEEREQASGNR